MLDNPQNLTSDFIELEINSWEWLAKGSELFTLQPMFQQVVLIK